MDQQPSCQDDGMRSEKSDFHLAIPSWTGFLSLDDKSESTLPQLLSPDGRPLKRRRRRLHKKARPSRSWLLTMAGVFILLGIIQFVSIVRGMVISSFPDVFGRATENWLHRHHEDDSDSLGGGQQLSHWPTDISRDIFPIKCHSHNDYWRRVPLFSALEAGCISVEADVWLFDNDLYVGHTLSALTPKRTLRNLYIEPLVRLLDRQNPATTQFGRDASAPAQVQGIFDTDPEQTLVLLIDFKSDGPATFSHVMAQLAPLRERGYLTHFNGKEVIPGPVTVVGTGNAPFDLLIRDASYRDIFFDAPLDQLLDHRNREHHHIQQQDEQQTPMMATGTNEDPALSSTAELIVDPDMFNTTNSYYASVNFSQSIGVPRRLRLTGGQIEQIRMQVRAAHQRGLKVRYWGVPSWPRSLRNHVWSVLVREGVDVLNVDDLKSAKEEDWTRPRGWSWWN